MAQFEQFTYVDLSAGIRKVPVNGGIFSHDIKSHKLGVIVTNHGVPVELTGSILGIAKLATGEKLEFSGVLDSTDTSKAYVELPESAYITGPLTVAIRNIDTNDNKIVLIAYTGYVDGATDGTPVVPPGTLPDDIDEFIAELAAIRSDVVGCENLNISQTKSGNTITVTTTDRTGTQTSNTISGFDSSGSYADMTVGNAEQLVATVGVEDQVPYLFRTSGGSADIGDREVDKIVGGTIAWNQKANNSVLPSDREGIDFTNNGSTFTMSGTSEGMVAGGWFELSESYDQYKAMSGHKVLISLAKISGSASDDTKVEFTLLKSDNIKSTVALGQSKLYSFPVITSWTTSTRSQLAVIEDTVLTNLKCAIQVTDLTAAFGPTIADYVYGLETANAGAGVAWFRKLFPKPYYAYDADSLQSVQAAAHVTIGFNQWDEEWELGIYNPGTGAATESTAQIRSKNAIHVIPGVQYYFTKPANKGAVNLCYYDDAGKFLSFVNPIAGVSAGGIITIPDGAHYMRFFMGSGYGTTYTDDICINFSDTSRNGQYEPYVKHTYPLDNSLILRGITKLDSNNNLYYEGDEYASDGTVTRKYAEINLYDLSWTSRATGSVNDFYSSTLPAPYFGNNYGVNWIAAQYKYIGPSNAATLIDLVDSSAVGVYSFLNANASTSAVYIIVPHGTNPTSITAKLVYELATPTTEQADPYQNPQAVDDWGTEEYIDTGVTASTPTRDVAIPVGHKTKYLVNLREKLEYLPSLVNADGKYAIQQTNGQMSLVAVPDELPTPPSSDGNYILTVTVNGSTKTYSWSKLS